MPKPSPQEFRDDVVRIAQQRDSEVTLAQIAKDFGIHVGTLDKWMRQSRIDGGERPGVARSDNEELRELRKRNRLLEQENEVLRRAAAMPSMLLIWKTRSSGTASLPTRPGMQANRCATGRRGASAVTTAGGACSGGRNPAAKGPCRENLCTTISCSAISLRPLRTSYGFRTLRSTG